MERRGLRLALGALLVVMVAAAGCSAQQGRVGTGRRRAGSTETTSTRSQNTTDVYSVNLVPLNNSGVTGEATVTVTGTTIDVVVSARGLSADDKHPQHIHGFRNGQASSLPTETRLSDMEAEQFVGPPMLALEPFPQPDSDGAYLFEGTFEDASVVFPLDIRAIEIHGAMRDGRYDFTLPVAVGLLVPGPNTSANSRTGPGGTMTQPGAGGAGEGTEGNTGGGMGGSGGTGGGGGGNQTATPSPGTTGTP